MSSPPWSRPRAPKPIAVKKENPIHTASPKPAERPSHKLYIYIYICDGIYTHICMYVQSSQVKTNAEPTRSRQTQSQAVFHCLQAGTLSVLLSAKVQSAGMLRVKLKEEKRALLRRGFKMGALLCWCHGLFKQRLLGRALSEKQLADALVLGPILNRRRSKSFASQQG